MITVIGLLALLPLMMWAERAERFNRLSPVEQNLQRASHGAALVAFVLVVVPVFIASAACVSGAT